MQSIISIPDMVLFLPKLAVSLSTDGGGAMATTALAVLFLPGMATGAGGLSTNLSMRVRSFLNMLSPWTRTDIQNRAFRPKLEVVLEEIDVTKVKSPVRV